MSDTNLIGLAVTTIVHYFTCLYLPCETQASDYQQWNSQDSEDTWAQHGTLTL